jgi:hypothetical protein
MQAFAKNFGTPGGRTSFPHGFEDVIDVMGVPVGRLTLEPGWRWSNDVRPLMGSESCTLVHAGYCLSGRLHVEMDDGRTLDIGPDQLYQIPPGHDAWVVGSDPCRLLHWGGKVHEHAEPVAGATGGTR